VNEFWLSCNLRPFFGAERVLVTRQIAEELHTRGEFNMLESSTKRADAQQLFAARLG